MIELTNFSKLRKDFPNYNWRYFNHAYYLWLNEMNLRRDGEKYFLLKENNKEYIEYGTYYSTGNKFKIIDLDKARKILMLQNFK